MSMQVFISYNRSKFAYARLLHDLIEARLSCKAFMDLTSIDLGDDFERAVEEAEISCSVVVVLFACEWLLKDPASGQRPVDNPRNWLRREIATALRLKTRVIPVLVGDVSMPAAAELPDDIASLAHCQAIAIRDSEFDHDVERLIMILEAEINKELIGHSNSLDPKRFVADLVNYFPRFLKLLVMPKRVVRAYTANRDEELVRALAFLFISLAIFTLFFAPLLINKRGRLAPEVTCN